MSLATATTSRIRRPSNGRQTSIAPSTNRATAALVDSTLVAFRLLWSDLPYGRPSQVWDAASPAVKAAAMGHVDRIMGRDWMPEPIGVGSDPRWSRLWAFAMRCYFGSPIRPPAHDGRSLVEASIEHARLFPDWAGSRDAAGRFYGYLTRPQRARVNRYIASKIGLGKYDRPHDPARGRFEALIANCVHGVRLENRAMFA